VNRVKKWAPWGVLLVVAAVVLGIGLHRSSHPSLDAQVTHIAGQVRCPVCNGETVAESDAAVSVDIRNQIRTELLAHQSSDQILGGLVRAYGPGILEKPQPSGLGLLVWIIPVIAVAGGVAGLTVAFVRWRSAGAVVVAPSAAPSPSPSPSPEPALVGVGGPSLSVPVPAHLAGRWRPWVVIGLGLALVTAGACWALVAVTTTRLPGPVPTAPTLSAQALAADLQQAQQEAGKGNAVGAIKDYQKILASDPTQPEALTGEGWLLAQTGEPAFLTQGIQMLTSAEQSDPTYAPAHVYRGLAFDSEDDYGDAIPELRWYLAHSPDPQLAPRVRSLLAAAQAKVAAAKG
jgi:cytochrome c-type biogenesis protein CcmH